jgi:peptidoglycan/xylan/chitin deacetylase (PgdA/CDA1 family)/glycosyltransferase involved in cell wall biosynthesis
MTAIAVVIPCRNLGRYVPEALNSVREQTRLASEIVVIDDGSDDVYTRQVLNLAKSAGTCVVRTEHRGVGAARNTGIQLTSAPYLVLLDADDVLSPTFLERLGGVLDAHSSLDFVTCGLQAFGDADYTWTPPACTRVQTLARGGPHVSSMFRRRLWNAVGGFDDSLDGYEDTDFWMSAIDRGCLGEVIPEALLLYRVRSDSRYGRAINHRAYLPTMERLYRKHWPFFDESERTQLVLEKDRFILEQRAHANHLLHRKAELNEEVANLNGEISRVLVDLGQRHWEAFEWGDLRRPSPVSSFWGFDRGVPIDRHYIEEFLARHTIDIRGRVLEVKDSTYTVKYGGSRVWRSDVVDIDPENPHATINADLSDVDALPKELFDCFILTQTLHVVYDATAVIRSAHRVLKPGGVLLCTIPCVSRVSNEDGGPDNADFWRLTPAAARTLFAEVFPVNAFDVAGEGNLMACAAFLQGLAAHELEPETLVASDPSFPLICCVRAIKPAPGRESRFAHGRPRRRIRATRAAVLVYHRVGDYETDTHRLAINTRLFKHHMQHIRDEYEVMTLEDLCKCASSLDLPDRAVAVTFDDGYVDNLTNAAPLLADLGIPATFFITTDRLVERREYWWDIVEHALASARTLPPEFYLYADGPAVRSGSRIERAALQQLLVETLYGCSVDERTRLVERLIAWSRIEPLARDSHRRMTAAELCSLATQPNLAIGAHTVHHLNLPAQPLEVQRGEIRDCKRHLEQLLDVQISSFAYPYGEYSRDTVNIAREAGFQYAVTVDCRPVTVGAERWLLPRCEATALGPAEFQDWLKSLFAGDDVQFPEPEENLD